MNNQPYTIPPRWWEPRLSPWFVRLSRGVRAWKLRSHQRIQEVNVQGGQHLQDALRQGMGVMLCPNHSTHYDSNALYLAADQLQTPLYYMTAWQVFGMAKPWERRMMQWAGCFSIDRESADRKAFKESIRILSEDSYPLVVFPEGDIYHITDKVTPFREGAAAIALSASRKAKRPVCVVPCGIKFRYLDDPTHTLTQLMDRLDERLLLRPDRNAELTARVYRFAEALLALKEVEYLGANQSGSLPDRIQCLMHSILSDMESDFSIDAANRDVPERVKVLRQQIIKKLAPYKSKKRRHKYAAILDPKKLPDDLRKFVKQMDDLFLVMQLYCYPGDYLLDAPSIERIAETLDKFEEDVLGFHAPTVKGKRRVDIAFGSPMIIDPNANRRRDAATLTTEMQLAVQNVVDDLNS